MSNKQRPNVFLAFPSTNNSVHWGAAFSFAHATAGNCKINYYPCQTSALAMNFNIAWCGCLNERKKNGFTHFAMIHSDIIPLPLGTPWLDRLIAIMDRDWVNADVLAAVSPIKNSMGLTSTALETGDLWAPRRMTLSEIWKRPPTFTDPDILANTGLWVCRLGDWCEKICFTQRDQIMRDSEGRFYPAFIPEDWDFSRQARKFGKTIWVTREVALQHEYETFHTLEPWGDFESDPHVKPEAEPVAV